MTNISDLQTLQSEASNIVNRANDLLQSWSDGRRKLSSTEQSSLRLAHYTSLEAIVSMLQSRDGGLRLSDTSIMNDPHEGRATMEVRTILDLLDKEFKGSWLERRYSTANVCSFVGIDGASEESFDPGNDLLFWRLYGDDCRGISITMPPHISKELVESSIINRVMYTDKPSLKIELSSFTSLLNDLVDLRRHARDAGHWPDICRIVLSACDLLFKQFFLRKHTHYKMEHEYRAIEFVSGDDVEDSRYSSSGLHVKYGYIRRYVQIDELSCESILTTGSRITIGSNVPDKDEAKIGLMRLIDESEKIHGGVSVITSQMSYRPH